MTAREAAEQHYAARQELVTAAAAEAARLWREVDPTYLEGWSRSVGRLLLALVGAQRGAARQADAYVDRVLGELDINTSAAGAVNPARFSGVASDGRDLHRLLLRPVITSRIHIGRGESLARAKASGAATLDMIVRTQVADAGRVADGVAVAARPRVGYTRLLVGDSCSRCVVLAGRWYRYSSGFERHPRCDCAHIPANEPAARDDKLTTNPQAYFDSLSREEQDKRFTKAGAEAIREGADIAQVVNVRRGMYTAGGRKYTRSGAARGATRLMPEQIYRDASSRTEAIRLLRLHGFLI